MFGLHTSRVLLVDDNEDDALPILKSLGQQGIGVIYVSGTLDNPPPSQALTGIRVAILDIYLEFQGDPDTRMRRTVQLIDSIISRGNGPYVAVVWTSTPSDFEEFRTQISGIQCPPILAVALDKQSIRELTDPVEIAEQIFDAIQSAIRGSAAVDFSIQWEQLVHDATVGTFETLGLGPNAQATSESLDILAGLLKANASAEMLQVNERSSRALLAALNPIHFDNLEAQATARMSSLDDAIDAIRSRAGETDFKLSQDQIINLNTALMFDLQPGTFGAGAIYVMDDMRAAQLDAALPTNEAVRESTVEKEHLERANSAPLVLVEISASCDHQQGNTDSASFVAGIAFDADRIGQGIRAERIHPRTGDYMYPLEAINTSGVDALAAITRFAWNSRFPVTIPTNKITNLTPIGRIREPLLTCIRDWYANRSSRPGYLSVRQ